MPISSEVKDYKGEKVIELKNGKYTAMVAPFIGSNLMRMRDEELDIEFFRYEEDITIDTLKDESVIHGMPTLFYGNRLGKGQLRATDYTYQFEPNDPEGNRLHGFLHDRCHDIVAAEVAGDAAIARTRYIYDEKDPEFKDFPVKFTADFTFSLEEDGMHYEVTITNNSDRQLPYSICNHTCISAPFTTGADPFDSRVYITIGQDKWLLNPVTCLPTTETAPLDNHDKQYLTGSMVPVMHKIDNDVYNAAKGEVDGTQYRGAVISDIASGKEIRYEVDEAFRFWVVWNHDGDKGYFCPEPITWMIDAPNLPLHAEESGYIELAPDESKTVKEYIHSLIK